MDITLEMPTVLHKCYTLCSNAYFSAAMLQTIFSTSTALWIPFVMPPLLALAMLL
jgi:hypothetical protein